MNHGVGLFGISCYKMCASVLGCWPGVLGRPAWLFSLWRWALAQTRRSSAYDTVLLRDLPVRQPQQLVLFGKGQWVGSQGTLPDRRWQLFSYPFYREFRQKNQVFTDVAAIDSILFENHGRVASRTELEKINVELVSGTYFGTLGVNPVVGRALTKADDQAPGAHPVAVASYSWWQHRFAKNASAVGTTITIGSTVYSIIGVAPPEFFGTTVGQLPDLWIPLAMEKQISPGWNGWGDNLFQSLYIIARRKPGVGMSQATANTNLLFKQILHEYAGPKPSKKQLEDIQHASTFSVGDNPEWQNIEVVGVVKDGKYMSLKERPMPAAFYPHSQHRMLLYNFVARYTGEPKSLVPEIRRAVGAIDPNLPVSDVTTLAHLVEGSVLNQRLVAQLSTFFGALAAFLACIGIYGVMSYGITRRTNEFGIRMALGAQRWDVLRMVLGETLRLVLIGLVLGLALAVGSGRLVESELFGVKSYDPVALGLALVAMMTVALIAAYLPARRATKIDPMMALRYE